MTLAFFQAEDGIRDIGVTGVQTCALPIFATDHPEEVGREYRDVFKQLGVDDVETVDVSSREDAALEESLEIGRASCRERVQISVVAVSLKKKRDSGAISER